MTKYIGIHSFNDGSLYVELGEFEDYEEAYESMERNDAALTLLTYDEFKKISEIIKNNKKTWEGIFEVK